MTTTKARPRFRLGLRGTLILLFLVIGWLPLVATGAINLLSIREELRDRVIDDEQEQLTGTASEVERFLETSVDDLFLLSRSVVVQELAQEIVGGTGMQLQQARDKVEQEFVNFAVERRVGETPVYEHIRYLDSDGFELVRIDLIDREVTAASGFNLNVRSTEDYFQQARQLTEGAYYVSPIELFDEFGQIQEPYTPVLRYSTPVFVDEAFAGVVVTDVRAQGFLELIQASASSDTLAFLVDQDGYYLSHPDASKLYGRDLETDIRLETDSPDLISILDNPSADVIEQSNDIVVYHPIVPSEQADQFWVMVSIQPLETVLEPVNQQQNTLLLAFLIVGFIVAGIALYFARGIGKPIIELTETSAAIAGGDLQQRVTIERSDELGVLAQSFNSMTEQLSGLIETLEDRVNTRTRDLRIAADVSKQITTVLDIEQLLQQVATLTVQRFGLYAVLVFMFNENTQRLTVAKAANAQGEPLEIKDNNSIAFDAEPSVIALAARNRQAVNITDVEQSPTYLRLGELPGVRSELAIPMLAGDQLLGVFDLVSTQPARFGEEDQRVMTTLAEQIAIAARNAQLFTEAQQAREAAEQANQVKSKFLASMSHELRTPLNSILNFSELVANEILGPVTEDQIDALNEVVDSGVHLLGLINDILDLTKIEIGMIELLIEDVDVNEVLDGVLSTAKGLIKEKPRIKLISEVEAGLPSLYGDKRRIRQVFLNLISNAIKFTLEGSVTVAAKREDGNIHFIIKDTGLGIEPEDQAIIFESFRQAKAGLAEGTGTGLGLPITKRIVEEHRGRLWLESEVGVGTTFHVLLPTDHPPKA